MRASHLLACRFPLRPVRVIVPLVSSLGLAAALASGMPSVFAQIPTPDFMVEPDPSYFDGTRIDAVSWDQPQPMPTWSLVVVVRPTAESASGSMKTILTNDLAGWNDDVLFGISPEGDECSDAGRFAVIHQDDIGELRTTATAERIIEGDTRYHIAATSDGNHLGIYVNGILAFHPVEKTVADLDFGSGTIYIGGLGRAGIRQFVGDIESVRIYTIALTDGDIRALAMAEDLLDDVNIYCYAESLTIDEELVNCMTSIDFVDGNEVITALGDSRFLYRPIGDADWQVAELLVPVPVFKPHSIAWSESVMPARYFVADTENHRIVSFESLASDATYNAAPTIDETPLTRPHDLEFNPADGYFYGVAGPTDVPGDHILFRFRDIGDEERVRVLASGSGFYSRSLSVVQGVIYVVDSFGPQVIEIADFLSASDTTYTTSHAFLESLNAVEFHNGWWYGTGRSVPGDPVEQDLFRWRSWSDFESGSGSWEDLSSLILPFAGGTTDTAYNPYFLTCWNGRLFFAVYQTYGAPLSRIYEVIDTGPGVTSVSPTLAATTTVDLRVRPNPFNPSTTLSFDLPQAGHATLKVYDLTGRHVATLIDREVMAGSQEVQWHGKDSAGRDVSSGVYVGKLVAGAHEASVRMVLVR